MSFKIPEASLGMGSPMKPVYPARRRDRKPSGWMIAASLFVLTAACARTTSAAPTAAAKLDADGVKRVLTLLTVVGEEYREGTDESGALVRPMEYQEARSFLREARQRWSRLAEVPNAADVSQQITTLTAAIESKAKADTVLQQVAAIRTQIVAATGLDEDVYPPRPPSPERGAAIFRDNCASCHGQHGDGRGPDAANLNPKPANFTDVVFMRGETPYDFFHVITVGKREAAMPEWGDALTLQERWDVLSYVTRIAHPTTQLAEGQGIYLSQCASCHGAAGDGKGPYAARLLTRVPDLTRPGALSRRSDAELFDVVLHGVAGTAMPPFRSLTDDERWKAVAFIRALSLGGVGSSIPNAPSGSGGNARFGRLLRLLGAEYGKAVTGGQVVSPQDLTESEVLLGQVTAAAPTVASAVKESAPALAASLRRQVDRLAALIRQRAPAPDVVKITDAVVAALPAEEDAPPAASAGSPDALAETHRLLGAALAAYQSNDPQALSLVSDAYFQFEPLEKQLALAAPDVKGKVEAKFLQLRGLFGQAGANDQAKAVVAAIDAELDAARAALQPHANPYALFVQSATIILREGFEVVLIVTALLAYVRKSGNARMQRSIVMGTVTGVALSLVTAYVFAQLFRGASVGAAEALGGVTMLLAAVVLFWVSYWLVSKAEADKWQRFIQGKVKTALSAGSGVALAGVAFLAVFREGVETVLFYEALFGNASGTSATAVSGFIVGLLALAVVYFVLVRFGMRLPIGPFFLGTSLLLYYMAVVFAGRGVAELQETGWIGVTPVAGVPRIDMLGLYPTVETLLAQGILVALLVYAVVVILRRRTGAAAEREAEARPTDTLLAEVHSLHQLAVEIRSELLRRAAPASPVAEQTNRRLDALIERVTVLEGQMQLNLPSNRGTKPVAPKAVGH
jgi:high-affinity iron transporter